MGKQGGHVRVLRIASVPLPQNFDNIVELHTLSIQQDKVMENQIGGFILEGVRVVVFR